jgi:hypothetical protein
MKTIIERIDAMVGEKNESVNESKKSIDSTFKNIKLEEETLSDASKAYNVLLGDGAVEFSCYSEKDARELFVFITKGFGKKWDVN